jgi:hypothetical protein
MFMPALSSIETRRDTIALNFARRSAPIRRGDGKHRRQRDGDRGDRQDQGELNGSRPLFIAGP